MCQWAGVLLLWNRRSGKASLKKIALKLRLEGEVGLSQITGQWVGNGGRGWGQDSWQRKQHVERLWAGQKKKNLTFWKNHRQANLLEYSEQWGVGRERTLKRKARARLCRTLQVLIKILDFIVCAMESHCQTLMPLFAPLIFSILHFFSDSCLLVRTRLLLLASSTGDHLNCPYFLHVTAFPSFPICASSYHLLRSPFQVPGLPLCLRTLQLTFPSLPSFIAGQRLLYNSAT